MGNFQPGKRKTKHRASVGECQVPQQPLSEPWLPPRVPLQCRKGFRLFAGFFNSILVPSVGIRSNFNRSKAMLKCMLHAEISFDCSR